jgi:hypothetical protein
VDADLTALWQELAREAPLARAAMSNLVVFCRSGEHAAADLTDSPPGLPLDEVVSHHPARTIVLRHDPGGPEEPEVSPEAAVGVLTFGPDEARYGVEMIAVRSACVEEALPSIVRSLLIGDMPTSVWWTEDFSETGPLPALIAMARQVVYDSRHWTDVGRAMSALAPLLHDPFAPDLADINWRRLTPLREAVVHALASRGGTAQQPPAPVRIGHRPNDAALAWLLAAWLLQAEGTVEPAADRSRTLSVGEAPPDRDDVLTLSFGGELTFHLGTRTLDVEDGRGAQFSMAVPPQSDAEAIAAELRALMRDTAFHSALDALARRFAAA